MEVISSDDVVEQPLDDVRLLDLEVFADHRGSFTTTYSRSEMTALGIHHDFVQDSESVSRHAGTIRGVHFQLAPHAQGKLVRVLSGAIVDVAVDLRPASPRHLEHVSVTLSGDDNQLFWIPPGFGHGFCTLEPDTVVAYKVTAPYEPAAERAIRWDDARLGITWPVTAAEAVLSDRDANAGSFAQVEAEIR